VVHVNQQIATYFVRCFHNRTRVNADRQSGSLEPVFVNGIVYLASSLMGYHRSYPGFMSPLHLMLEHLVGPSAAATWLVGW
jgi:hypothetical protein